MSKETTNTKVAEMVTNHVKVSADALMNVVLDRSLGDKDQTIGAQREAIKFADKRISTLETELKVANIKAEEKTVVADDTKMVVVKPAPPKNVCPNCGYSHGNGNRTRCYDCGQPMPTTTNTGYTVLEYRNMDSVIEDIRKDESKKLKIDNVKLQEEFNNADFNLKQAEVDIDKLEKAQAEELTNAKRDVRERYQKEAVLLERKIDELVEENRKLEENKTDEEVEAARKQEIIDLKEQVTELNAVLEEAKAASTRRMSKFWNKIADRNETRKIEADLKAKEERVEQISNNYPSKAVQKDQWWKKGKYAKNVTSKGEGLFGLLTDSSNAYTSYPW